MTSLLAWSDNRIWFVRPIACRAAVQVQDVTTIVYVKWSRLNRINFLLKLYPNYSLTWSTRNIVYGAHAIALVAQADAKHIKDLLFLPFVKPLMDLDRCKRWINACIFDFRMLEKFCCLLPTRLPQVNYPFFNYSIR
jgi:hypothetical protein